MSRWQEQFDAHPIHHTLSQLKSHTSSKFDGESVEEFTERRRISKCVTAYQKVLARADPELVPQTLLTSLNNHLVPHVLNQVNSYVQNRDLGHLTNANNQLETQLNQLAILVGFAKRTPSKSEVKAFEKEADRFAESVIAKKSELENEIADQKSLIEEFKKNLEVLSSQIETRRKDIDQHFSEWQKQFSETQNQRLAEYSSWRQNIDEKASSDIRQTHNELNKKLEDSFESFDARIEHLIEDADNKHQRILELYQLSAGDSVSGAYFNNADEEKAQADRWRVVSITFLIATTAWLSIAYFTNGSMTSEHIILWPKLLATISLAGVLLWGSAYSAQQSTKHRNNEKRTRWFALEVKAIDPFINALDPAQQQEIKKHLSERMFGQAINVTDSDTKITDEHAVRLITSLIDKAIKSKSGAN